MATNTRKLSAMALEKLDAHLNGASWDRLDAEPAAAWILSLRKAGYSPHTVESMATYAKAFLTWRAGVERLGRRMRDAFRIDLRRAPQAGRLVETADFHKLVTALPALMDPAFAAGIWETGFRVSECISLDVESVNFGDKDGAWLQLPKDGYDLKTGARRVYVTRDRVNLLHAWLQVHPMSDDRKAPLWVGDHGRNLGRRIGKAHVSGR